MVFVAPPVYTPDGLVAPWRLYARVTVPFTLLPPTVQPSWGEAKLVVTGVEVATVRLSVAKGVNAWQAEGAEWFTSIDWPQRKYVPVRDEAYQDVREVVVGAGGFYTAIYAATTAEAKVCVGDVCEDTDRDNDGMIEVVYLARPGERVKVSCTELCTVRVWRVATLSRLDAYLEVSLYDANGAHLGSWRFPVQTLEAPVFAPEGFTIRIDPKAPAPVAPWPWCGVPHPGVEPLPSPPEWDVMTTPSAYIGATHVYELNPSKIPAGAQFGANTVYGGVSYEFATGYIDEFTGVYAQGTGLVDVKPMVELGWKFRGCNTPCNVESVPARIIVNNVQIVRDFLKLAVIIAGEEQRNVILSHLWGVFHYSSTTGVYEYVPYTPPGYTLTTSAYWCYRGFPYSATEWNLTPWRAIITWLDEGEDVEVHDPDTGEILYRSSDSMLIGNNACRGVLLAANISTYAFLVELREPCSSNAQLGYGAFVKRVDGGSVLVKWQTTKRPHYFRMAATCKAFIARG